MAMDDTDRIRQQVQHQILWEMLGVLAEGIHSLTDEELLERANLMTRAPIDPLSKGLIVELSARLRLRGILGVHDPQ